MRLCDCRDNSSTAPNFDLLSYLRKADFSLTHFTSILTSPVFCITDLSLGAILVSISYFGEMDGLSAASGAMATVSLALQLLEIVKKLHEIVDSIKDSPSEIQEFATV